MSYTSNISHNRRFKFAFLYRGEYKFGNVTPDEIGMGDPFFAGILLDKFHCFSEQITWRKPEELDTGGDPAGNLFIVWTNYDYKLAKERREKRQKEQKNIAEKDAYEEKIKNQINTCSQYGFEKGSEPFMQCINDLMKLDLEYAKLHNEQLLLEAQIEQAKANKQSNLLSELQLQALIAQQSQALEIQNFNSGMNSLLLGLELMSPSQPTTPTITCHDFGTITQCY